MVKALHRAGIEVILDVVFNHTPRAITTGRRFASAARQPAYYILEARASRYADYSGCGNTLNANTRSSAADRGQPALLGAGDARRRLPFDLASILSRDPTGAAAEPAVLWDIESEPALAGTKLIAEAWDAAGLYQVGSFIGDAGRNGTAASATTSALLPRRRRLGRPLATACSAAPGSTAQAARSGASVNFVTCHDGFTLNDSSRTTASTTRRTARTTATAPTTTAAGTAASRARPTTRRSSGCAIVR
jgi:glycogen operon protein